MNTEQFKQIFLASINWGWSGEYAAELTTKANDTKKLAKIYNRVKLVAYRNSISEGDALHHLISRGKLSNI